MAATFAAVFTALYVAHHVGDHWIQTEAQAQGKGAAGWPGRLAAARHVGTLTLTAAALLALVGWRLGLALDPDRVGLGLLINAFTHWWADRRWTLGLLADRMGKGGFARLGGPLGGAYLLDQSWHVAWLFVTALVIA